MVAQMGAFTGQNTPPNTAPVNFAYIPRNVGWFRSSNVIPRSSPIVAAVNTYIRSSNADDKAFSLF